MTSSRCAPARLTTMHGARSRLKSRRQQPAGQIRQQPVCQTIMDAEPSAPTMTALPAAPASYRYTPSQAQQAMQSWWVRLVQHPLWFGGLAAAVFALLVVAAGFSIWN